MIKLWRFFKKSLRIRLTAWYALLLTITLLVFCVYLFWQLERNLLAQIDTTLAITSSEMLNTLSSKNQHPAFWETSRSQAVSQRLHEAGLAVRLLDQTGKIWDEMAVYQNVPQFLPRKNGYVNLQVENQTWRVYNQHFVWQYQAGWIQIIQSLHPLKAIAKHLLTVMILGVPFMVIIASCGGFFLSDQALRPITQIISTAQEIHHQEIERRINYQGSLDEVGHLALTLDRMLDRLQVAIEHERRFISDASHELRTPLTIIKGRISVTLSRPRTRREYIQTLVELEQQVDSLIRLAHGLLFLSRLEQEYLVKERVDITNLLTLLVEQVQSLARDKDIPLTATIAPNLILEGNWDYLTSLFLNLLDNAYKYTPETGEIFLEATQLHGRILVHITNTDVGIPPQALPHLFERFYRIQEDRSRYTGGAGLGLAIAKEIVYLHGAEITVTSQAGEFTRFSLSFAAL